MIKRVRLTTLVALLIGLGMATSGSTAALAQARQGDAPPTTRSVATTLPVLGPIGPLDASPDYGAHGTFFMQVTSVIGGTEELVSVHNDGIWWGSDRLTGPFYGQIGTYAGGGLTNGNDTVFAVNKNGIFSKAWGGLFAPPSIREGTFGPTVRATSGPFYGSKTTAFADVNGDGRLDAIAVNTTGVFVKLGRPNGTFGPTRRWTAGPFYGSVGTFFADVNGDGKADAIRVNTTGTTIRLSTGTALGPTAPQHPH